VNISHLAPIALGPRQAVRAPGARPPHRTMSAHRTNEALLALEAIESCRARVSKRPLDTPHATKAFGAGIPPLASLPVRAVKAWLAGKAVQAGQSIQTGVARETGKAFEARVSRQTLVPGMKKKG